VIDAPDIKSFIDGAMAGGARRFPNISPQDGRVLGHVHEATREDVDAAVRAARHALPAWAALPQDERVRLLHAVADGIMARIDDFVAAEVADNGMPAAFARRVDVPRGAANFRIFADLVRNVPTESFAMTAPDGSPAMNYTLRTPRGVIAVVCPWNLPLLLTTWKVGPALACGNTVVVKPSEETPTATALLADVIAAAGIPAGVFNVVQGFGAGSTGEWLTQHPGVDGVTFTGETATGEAIMAAAAKGVRPVSFELGGKNPAIVFADADLDRAVATLARAAFENCGQVCLGTERIYVERPVFDRFVAGMKAAAEALVIGRSDDPATMLGPLISIGHRDKVLGYYARALADGATLVTGGGIPEVDAALAKGAWIEPTIWTGLPDTSAICREEIFGPCCHIAPFDAEDEVVGRANDTPYGLCASIWTRDLARAHRMAAAVEVGICWINSWFLRDLRTAFGGAKQSGIGREGGVHSLEFYSELRNVCIAL
jgi:aminomuconate-semialdehyde/2-hydroxymuconate-6-semialdehyde dehydrogenase